MDYSRKISERLWNLPDKGELESHREETFIDDIIQKSHIQKELLSNLEGIKTVFDGGAGCGRFSILLAKQGCEVTHFDISQPMIDKAKELLVSSGGSIEDIAVSTGFANASYFCKVFKSVVGITPTEFAQKSRRFG